MSFSAGIDIHRIKKKLGHTLLFDNFSASFNPGSCTSIVGKNGSGKSTLLHLISGLTAPDKGNITVSINGKQPDDFSLFRYFSVSAPWHTPDFPLRVEEFLFLVGKVRGFHPEISFSSFLEISGIGPFLNIPLRGLSSGQMQRLKNATAFLTDAPILLLDEPLSHLDDDGAHCFSEMAQKMRFQRTVLVCSNFNPREYFFCDTMLSL